MREGQRWIKKGEGKEKRERLREKERGMEVRMESQRDGRGRKSAAAERKENLCCF